MRKLISIKKSQKEKYKLVATFEMENGRIKHVHFGSKPNKDYIIYSKSDKNLAEKKRMHILQDIQKITKIGIIRLLKALYQDGCFGIFQVLEHQLKIIKIDSIYNAFFNFITYVHY